MIHVDCQSMFRTVGISPYAKARTTHLSSSLQSINIWPYCAPFQLYMQQWVLKWLGIVLLVSNCPTRCKKFQEVEIKVFFLSEWSHMYSQLCSLLSLEWWMYFEHVVQSYYVTHIYLVSTCKYEPHRIPLKCRCPFRKSDHIKSTYLDHLTVWHSNYGLGLHTIYNY